MVYSSAINGGMRYGTHTSRERPHDSGGASSDPTESRKPDHSGQASRDHPKTVAKWKRRTSVHDLPTGPTPAKSTTRSSEEEAIIVAFRRQTVLPLDDCLYAWQATIPHLTCSSLHRCLQRHGISRLPEVTGDKQPKKKFKTYPIGYFHIDIAEV